MITQMWALFIFVIFIKSCLFASRPLWSDDDITRTKIPDPWVITTVGQPFSDQPAQRILERPPFLQGDFSQGQLEYIKGLLFGFKYPMLTNLYGSAFKESIPDGSGIDGELTQTKGYACVGYKACPGDRRYYLEFDSVNWVKRPCPYGYAFDDNSCYCSTDLRQTAPTTLASPSNTQKIMTSTPTAEVTGQTAPSSTTTPTTETRLAQSTSTTMVSTETPQIPSTSRDTTTIYPPTTAGQTTAAGTTQEPVSSTETVTLGIITPELQLCTRTITLNNAGFTRLPGSCDIFVQCRFVGDLPSSVNTRRCSNGLLWNQDKLTCDYARNVNCTSERSCFDKQAVPDNRGEYLLLTKTGWVVSLCPVGTGYNESTCSCSDKFVYEHLHPQCPDKIPISDDPRGFLEFNGVTWTYVPCPDTLLYDHSSCACSFAPTDPYQELERSK